MHYRSCCWHFLCSPCASLLLRKGFFCASAVEKGHARVVNASAHLLEYDDFTVGPEALVGVANLDEIDVPAWRFLCSACKCTCTSLPLKETRVDW